MDDLSHLPNLDDLPIRKIVYTPPPRDETTWIQTYTGRKVWPLNPHPDDIEIADIAHALALMNRYAGHTHFPYSVAQHCVLMYDAMVQEGNFSQDELRWALLHDATEAYIADVARPIKKGLGNYEVIEENLMECIATKFGISWPMPEIVKQMDLVMLATERYQLMPGPVIPWGSLEGVTPIPCKIEEWRWTYAKKMFLDRFRDAFSSFTQKAA